MGRCSIQSHKDRVVRERLKPLADQVDDILGRLDLSGFSGARKSMRSARQAYRSFAAEKIGEHSATGLLQLDQQSIRVAEILHAALNLDVPTEGLRLKA